MLLFQNLRIRIAEGPIVFVQIMQHQIRVITIVEESDVALQGGCLIAENTTVIVDEGPGFVGGVFCILNEVAGG